MTKAALLHLLTEFAPVLVFFVAGQIYSFEMAAIILVVSTALSMTVSLWYEKRIPFLPLLSGLFVIISGSITYLISAPDVLIFADTIYYFLLAAVVGIGLLRKQLFLKWLFNATFAMYDQGWRILSYRWLTAFIIAGSLNEAVRLLATPEVWVDFRFVKVILIAGFGFYQFTLSRRYRIPDISNHLGLRLTKVSESKDYIETQNDSSATKM